MAHKLTQEQFESKFYSMYEGRYKVIGRYINAKTPVEIECLTCHNHFCRTPNLCDKGKATCSFCNKNGDTRHVHIGIDDMWTTNPTVAKCLKNPKDGIKYRFSTDVKLEFSCPLCGKSRKSVPKIHKNYYICPYCSDNISYPNKLMANLLDLAEIPFTTEYKFKKSKYRYDFHFVINNTNYLIEMDGRYGHGYMNTLSTNIEEQIRIDKEKDDLAKFHEYKLIRIDCAYIDINSRKEYIAQHILSSELSQIITISEEMLNQADAISYDSQCVKFANAWNNHNYSYDHLMDVLRVRSRTSVRVYAKQAISLGLIDESYESFLSKVRLSSNAKLAYTKGSPVYCVQLGKAFCSISEAERIMGISSLRNYFSKKREYCGSLPDGTKLTWKKITKKEYQALIKNR